MIVQCASCQTKFRVPDDKIGEKPVKVRCSKCQSVFSVKRGADGNAVASALPGAKAPPPAPPPVAPPAAPADPFAAFGPPPPRPPDATTPGVWHAGIAESRREQNEVTRRAPMPDIEPTRPGFALNALVASKLDAPAPPPAVEAAPDPFAGPPPSSPADPFAGPPPSSPTDPFATAPPPAPMSALDPFGGSAEAGPPPVEPEPAEPGAVDPFANLDLASAAPPLPAPAPAKPDPFANLDLGAVAGKSPAGEASRAAPSPELAPQAPGVSFSFESGQGEAAPAEGSADDFFASAEPASHPQSSVGADAFGHDETTTQTQASGEPDRSLFDLPARPPPAPLPAPETPFDNVPTRVAPMPKPVPRPAAPSTKPATPKKPLGQRLIGGLVSALFVVAVGWASLLTYATARADWHFDPGLLRPAELGRAVFGKQGAAAQLALEDVSSGTYALRDGRTAFYVRGELVNRGKAPLGPARAHVELLDADRVLASAEAWAGQPVTPEQVYELGDAQQLEALRQQERGQARPLAPGESRPFVAVMLDVPGSGSSAIRSVRIVPDLGGAK